MDLSILFAGEWNWLVLSEILGVNIVLSGDNAILIALAAAGLPPAERQRAILFGMVLAVFLRIILSVVAVQLLAIPGVLLAGGLVLLWIAYGFFRELRADAAEAAAGHQVEHQNKTLMTALRQIVIADISMSLDNVLAVAGAAHGNMMMLTLGLTVSILLMGVAATLISRLIQRYNWIAYVGLALIVFIACEMIYEDGSRLLGWGHSHAALGGNGLLAAAWWWRFG